MVALTISALPAIWPTSICGDSWAVLGNLCILGLARWSFFAFFLLAIKVSVVLGDSDETGEIDMSDAHSCTGGDSRNDWV